MSAFDNLFNLPISLSCNILSHWLSIRQVAKLDSACCSNESRPTLLKILSSREFAHHLQISISQSIELSWCMMKNIGASSIKIDAVLRVGTNISNYFLDWGKYIREVYFTADASGDLYLIPMHCRNLLSVSCHSKQMELIFHDILFFNPTLRVVAVHSVYPCSLKDIHLPQLRKLEFTNFLFLGKESCQEMAQLCDSLTHLNLSRADLESPELVLEFTSQNKCLNSLDFSCSEVNSTLLSTIAQQCPRIVNLSLYNCVNTIDDAAILHIAQHMTNLRTLDIRGCSELREVSLVHLTQHCAARLDALFFYCSFQSLFTIAALLQACTNLHTLGLEAYDEVHFSSIHLHNVFKPLQHIRKLHLRGVGLIADNILMLVGQYCISLTHLALLPEDEVQAEHTGAPDGFFTPKGILALKEGCLRLRTLIVHKNCPLLKNKLAILMWQTSNPGFFITSDDTLNYDPMKCGV